MIFPFPDDPQSRVYTVYVAATDPAVLRSCGKGTQLAHTFWCTPALAIIGFRMRGQSLNSAKERQRERAREREREREGGRGSERERERAREPL